MTAVDSLSLHARCTDLSARDEARLWSLLALRSDYRDGICWAWVESRGAICGKADDGAAHLCKRHTSIAAKRLAKEQTKEQAREQDAAAYRVKMLPTWRKRLATVEAEMRRLDPPPPTTDMAAFGGVGSVPARRYQARLDRIIPRMAELSIEAEKLRRQIGADSVSPASEDLAHA